MEKIPSFTVNHLILEPGIYISRVDALDSETITTFDLRMTRPNREPVLNTAEIHTIEHIGATYLRNHPGFKNTVIYFGPMGCRTGFYLLLKGKHDHETLHQLIVDAFTFISEFKDDIPGASARDCGNFLDQNLPMANYVAKRYVKDLKKLPDHSFTYQD